MSVKSVIRTCEPPHVYARAPFAINNNILIHRAGERMQKPLTSPTSLICSEIGGEQGSPIFVSRPKRRVIELLALPRLSINQLPSAPEVAGSIGLRRGRGC